MGQLHKYHQIKESWDEKLLGRRSGPQSVKITTPGFFTDVYPIPPDDESWDYFAFQKELFAKLDGLQLSGKLDYKKPIDFMCAYYSRITMIACVSEKVKRILEDLNVSREELTICPITLEGIPETYYVLFSPVLSVKELGLDFSRTLFKDDSDEGKLYHFSDEKEMLENYNKEGMRYSYKNIVISRNNMCRKIINVQYGGIFFSETIMDAFAENGVVGYDYIRPGSYFYKELDFS